jgi:hypothetical protein
MNRIRAHAFAALGWIAFTLGATADAKPFDRMIGCWTGQAELFKSDGTSMGTATSTGSVTWNTSHTVMHFKQVTQPPGNPPPPPQTQEYDFNVSGKVAKVRSADVDVTGTEIDPRTYEFVLHFKKESDSRYGIWYNVHYFTSKGRRLVIGGFQAGGSTNDSEVENLATQRLKRVACPREQVRRNVN